jgi:hypothetical protein
MIVRPLGACGCNYTSQANGWGGNHVRILHEVLHEGNWRMRVANRIDLLMVMIFDRLLDLVEYP